VERAFTVFDQNQDGVVCIDEYTEIMKKLAKSSEDEATAFLFRIFDYNGILTRTAKSLGYLRTIIES
jgi:Ca2+-binding EF-hand superfamily protein